MGGGNGTHDVGMIETLEHPYLAPHALFTPLDFASSESPSVRPRMRRPQEMAREGFRVVAEESGVAGSELGGGGEGWVGGSAARRSARVHRSAGTCHVARCHNAMTTMWACDISSIISECVHTRDSETLLTRTVTFSKRATPEDVMVADLVFADGGCAVTIFGRRARTFRCRCADRIRIGDNTHSRLSGWFLRASRKWEEKSLEKAACRDNEGQPGRYGGPPF